MLNPEVDEIQLEGRKGGEADGTTEDGGFDLSGLEDLQAEQNQTGAEESEAKTQEEESSPSGESESDQAPKKWRVGDTDYENPDAIAEDFKKLHGSFTQVSQELAAMKRAAEQGQAPTKAEVNQMADDMDKAGFTDEQIEAAKKLFGVVGKQLGYVSREELERERFRDKFETQLDRFVSSHDGSDGLPKAEKEKLVQFMGENGFGPQHIESAYKLMHMDAIQEVAAKKYLEKKITPPKTTKTAPSSGQIPQEPESVNFDDPDSMARAYAGILDK